MTGKLITGVAAIQEFIGSKLKNEHKEVQVKIAIALKNLFSPMINVRGAEAMGETVTIREESLNKITDEAIKQLNNDHEATGAFYSPSAFATLLHGIFGISTLEAPSHLLADANRYSAHISERIKTLVAQEGNDYAPGV